MYLIKLLSGDQVPGVLFDAVATTRWNLSQEVMPIECYRCQHVVVCEGAETRPVVPNFEMSETPLAIKVFGQQLLHEGKRML